MSYQVEQITEPLGLGEGPHWDDRTQALYFVGIVNATIHKYVPATKEHTKTKSGGNHVSFIIPVANKTDQFVVGMDRKFVIIQWDGQNDSEVNIVKELFRVDPLHAKNKVNDAKVDFKGRLYAGTVSSIQASGDVPKNGSIFRLDGADRITTLDTGIMLSNGLAFNEKAKSFYYVDTWEKRIRKYDWDPSTGNISNKQYCFDFKKNGIEGLPDGGTIDTDGNLWWTVFGGSCVVQVNPNTGEVLRKIEIPALQVTSCTFGGPGLDVLFVTTASLEFEGQKPPGGSVYMVTGLGAKGHPNLNFKL